MQDLRYPIGEFAFDASLTHDSRAAIIDELAGSCGTLRTMISGLTDPQLDTPYREGGWTLRQLVHHLADSSLNWYIRFKAALTELDPHIKPFDQDSWSALPDARTLPPEVSVDLLNAVHLRMAAVMRAMRPEDFNRTLYHPERGSMTVDCVLQALRWHMRHHMAHIASLRKSKGW
jgi:uncharacterized damage-inducible protein DinB